MAGGLVPGYHHKYVWFKADLKTIDRNISAGLTTFYASRIVLIFEWANLSLLMPRNWCIGARAYNVYRRRSEIRARGTGYGKYISWCVVLLLALNSPVSGQDFLEESDEILPGMLGGVAAWSDYDGDGDDDLLLVGEILEEASPSRVARIYDNVGADFIYNTVASEELVGIYRGDAAWGDYDSDGYPDIAIVGWNSEDEEKLLFYRNTDDIGERRLKQDLRQIDLTGSRYASLAWGDYDGDGDVDLIVAGMEATGNSQTRLYRNIAGLFIEDDVNSSVVIGVHNGDIAWADYDNDGDYDLSISGDNVTYAGGGIVPETKFYKNDPVGSLDLDRALSDPIEDSSSGVRRGAMAWGDYDGDGAVDLALSGRLWNSEI